MSSADTIQIGLSTETLPGCHIPTLCEVLRYLIYIYTKERRPRTTPIQFYLNEAVDVLTKSFNRGEWSEFLLSSSQIQ